MKYVQFHFAVPLNSTLTLENFAVKLFQKGSQKGLLESLMSNVLNLQSVQTSSNSAASLFQTDFQKLRVQELVLNPIFNARTKNVLSMIISVMVSHNVGIPPMKTKQNVTVPSK